MLQWMGGSRRKVIASRKSAHKRQKQYFEQRKRQQQAPGFESQIDIRNKQVHYHEEPRSLDIVSLTNLATIAQHGYCNFTSEDKYSEVDPDVSKLSPAAVLRKITMGYTNDLNEKCSEPGISSTEISVAIGYQDETAVCNARNKLADSRMSASSSASISSNIDFKKKEQKEEVQGGNFSNCHSEVSLLDLLSDDESKCISSGRSLPEAHVAFSVKGLGKVGMETPIHSPRQYQRIFLSPPKASSTCFRTDVSRSVAFDVAMELNSVMLDISMISDGKPVERMDDLRSILDESDYRKRSPFIESSSPDSYEGCNNNFDDEDEDKYNGLRYEGRWQSKGSPLDGNLLDKDCDGLWKAKPFPVEGFFSTSSHAEDSNMHDFSFKDQDFLKIRTAEVANSRFDISAISTPCFSHSPSERKPHIATFDWERSPTSKKRSNLDFILSPSTWSFMEPEDSQDGMSLLSEESCSSTGVREERSYNLGSQSVKMGKNKINQIDDLQMSLDRKYNLHKIAADEVINLDEKLQGGGPAGALNCRNMTNQLNSKAGYCSQKASGPAGILEPECLSSLKENSGNQASPSSCPKGSNGRDTISSDYKIISENKLFNLFPDLKINPTIDLSNKRSKLKLAANHEPSSSISCNGDLLRQRSGSGIRLQRPVTHPSMSDSYIPYSFCAGASTKDIEVYDLSGKKNVRKNNEVEDETYETPENKMTLATNSINFVTCGPTIAKNYRDKSSEHEEVKMEEKKLSDGSETRNHHEVGKEIATGMKGIPSQLQGCISDALKKFPSTSPVESQVSTRDHHDSTSPLPSQLSNPLKGKLGSESMNNASIGKNSCDAEYQVIVSGATERDVPGLHLHLGFTYLPFRSFRFYVLD
ncbi:uncharacterized protein [Typha angustifolia]|uniref:uncharacterized protein n=1 Tax=Typha angustifolia TaxID=59011 RepID=UPI003C2BC5D3